jgi:quercetin dioxygenase-like cupin family protein
MNGVRRVVTGHNDLGEAIVLSDDKAPFLHTSPGRPGFWSNDIWRTAAFPVPISENEEEPTLGPRRQLPTTNGTVFRINQIPPESGLLDSEAIRREFQNLGNISSSTFKPGSHPMMHQTETIDYVIVLNGEIYMVLDKSEVLLKAGDVAVQRGTNHAWSNRSKEPCVICFVLLDGRFEMTNKS